MIYLKTTDELILEEDCEEGQEISKSNFSWNSIAQEGSNMFCPLSSKIMEFQEKILLIFPDLYKMMPKGPVRRK